MPVKDYNADPDLNTQISGINIAEGCAPSGINNAIRQLMADVKEEFEGEEGVISTLDASLRALIAEEVGDAASEASSQLSSLDSTLRALIAKEVAKYLPLAGGTMEGEVIGVGYVQKLKNIDVTATPSSSIFEASIRFTDKNGKLFAMLQPAQWSNGGNALRLIVAKKDGSQGAPFSIEQTASGETLFAVGGNKIVGVAAEWTSGANGYRKYANGWIEQWGQVTTTSNQRATVQYHTPFANAVGTTVLITARSAVEKTTWAGYLESKSTTNFIWNSNLGNVNVKIDWYACGY